MCRASWATARCAQLIGFVPFAIAMAIGRPRRPRLVTRFSPRVVVIAGGIVVLGATLCASTCSTAASRTSRISVLPIVFGAIGLGMIGVPLALSLIASVGADRIGPASAIAVMLQSLGGPMVLVAIQVVITSRTLHLGGTNGPVKVMNAAQLHALDHGYTLRPAVAGRGGHLALRGGAAHQLHRTAGGACAEGQERHRCRSGVAQGRFVSRSAPSGRTQPACVQPARAKRASCSPRPVGRRGGG